MKSLKITLIAIASITILTGVSSIDTETVTKEDNKEVKEVQVDLISMTDKKVSKVPTQG
ncbi:hypothetical protein [Mesoflavibacter sp. SCSIO 43206]|uniref:hypothetical protein n=1 Tax=Mesoflavibacter sp. SCSIO 43206 TaxID=2779362 RepID=UPI001CA86511|nr:hypothetical protein [Mesoflavibacter sp. SCSIO 43206]UAB76142.1 hypothetical protein INR78_03910 [Mesoflavibacter sp. SCSIO 43206]